MEMPLQWLHYIYYSGLSNKCILSHSDTLCTSRQLNVADYSFDVTSH